MMSTAPISIDELLETFDDLQEWDERYGFLIELGAELPAMDPQLQNDSSKVDGCMSQVWMVADVHSRNGDSGVMEITADSDSMIVKGLIAVLLALFNDKTPEEVVESDPEEAFERLGLKQHLSGQRRNGLYSMVQRIKTLAKLNLPA